MIVHPVIVAAVGNVKSKFYRNNPGLWSGSAVCLEFLILIV
jgi:hypothetical protein